MELGVVIRTVPQKALNHTRKSIFQPDIVGVIRAVKLAYITVVCVNVLDSFVLKTGP